MESNFSEESHFVPKSRQPVETGQPRGSIKHTHIQFLNSGSQPLPYSLKCKASGS